MYRNMAKYASSYWTDEMLLDLIQRKDDRAAFAELYDRYWKFLIDMAGKRTLSIEAAEEIVQDVFVDFFIRRKDIQADSLEAYLRTAVKYQIYKTYRSQQVHESYVNTAIAVGQLSPLRPDTVLETKQLKEDIHRATEKMPVPCREVFLLSRVEQLSNQSIANRLDISLAMVRKHVTKSMNIMRSEFKDYQINLPAVILFIFFGNTL